MPENDEPKSILDWLGYTSAPQWKHARKLGYFFGSVFLLLFIMSLSAAFVIVGNVILGALSQDVTTAGQLSAGALIVALLGAPFLIWRTMIAHQTLGFQKEGHITDRISKAVEQLGAVKNVKKLVPTILKDENLAIEETIPNIEVRIGAILSLERIAQDSVIYDNGRDHVRIMEILSAYVRNNTNDEAIDFHLPDWSECEIVPDTLKYEFQKILGDTNVTENGAILDSKLYERNLRFGRLQEARSAVREWLEETVFPDISEDIVLALKVIGRRTSKQRSIERKWLAGTRQSSGTKMKKAATANDTEDAFADGYRIDLRGVNLQKINLSDLDFSGTLFDNARLEGSNFANCLLIGVSLYDTNLIGAHLYNVDLTSATGRSTKFESAYLCASTMNCVRFFDCDFNGVNFSNSVMISADFERSRFICSSFVSAEMRDCKFMNTNLFFSYFAPVKAVGTDFSGANMKQADLTNANLEGAEIQQEAINNTKSNGNTRIPNNLIKPPTWKYTDLFN